MEDRPDPGPPIVMQTAATVRLDGPDGVWTGTGRILTQGQAIGADVVPELTHVELLVLEGEDGYEGLFATLVRVTYGADDTPYEGYIFEGELPDYPDPVEPWPMSAE